MPSSGYKPFQLANPYEQIVKVYAAIFSVLVGISLRDLLTPGHFGGQNLNPALAFAATLFLVIRFLVGSANHLWVESLEHSGRNLVKQSAWGAFIGHFLGLTLFGFLAIRICRSTGIDEILRWTTFFTLLGAAVAVVFEKVGSDTWFSIWRGWFWINFVQAAAFGIVWYWRPHDVVDIFGRRCTWDMLLAAVVAALGLIVDLRFQIVALERIARGPDIKTTPNVGGQRPNSGLPANSANANP